MIKHKKIAVFLIICLLLFKQHGVFAQDSINQFNSKGERTGIWKKNYGNNRIRYIGTFKDGKEVGVFKYYAASSSDFPIAIKTFENNSDYAKVKFFTEKGVLKSEGRMKGKIRVGKWLYYHLDGKTIMSEENYTNGVLNGESKTYYKTGIITESLHYKNGKLHGNCKRYSDEKVLLDDLNYRNGKLFGPAKYYSVKGQLIYWGDYENDVKVGKWNYVENQTEKKSN